MSITYFTDKNGRVVPRKTRPSELQSRLKAIAAAREIIETNGNRMDVAKKHGAERTAINFALVVLRHGTPEEIAAIETTAALRETYNRVRARTPPEARRKKKATLSEETRKAIADEVAIFNALRSALEALADLPRPADVMTIVKKNGVRTKVVQQSLSTAYSWIEEFADAWTK